MAMFLGNRSGGASDVQLTSPDSVDPSDQLHQKSYHVGPILAREKTRQCLVFSGEGLGNLFADNMLGKKVFSGTGHRPARRGGRTRMKHVENPGGPKRRNGWTGRRV